MSIKSKKSIIFFRHGQTDWNLEGRIQGHLDIPLNQTGKDQALHLAEHIKNKNLDIIVSSDLLRAHETAIIIGKHCNVPVITVSALRELHVGVAGGVLKKDFQATESWTYIWSSDPRYDHLGFEEGETKRAAKARISEWLKTYLEQTPHTRIGICGHGFILKLLLVDLGYEHKHLANTEFVEIEL